MDESGHLDKELEHSSIVPVYEIGRRSDGRFYYTMKLVRGKTLAGALRECKSLQDRLDLLGHFENLCEAIAYAHSPVEDLRSGRPKLPIIHRDIKPDNVMVGDFRQTTVLDWGLAKVKADAGPAIPAEQGSGGGPAGRDVDRGGAVAERALQADRLMRYQSARDLMEEIQAYRSKRFIKAYHYSLWEIL